jgi:hypothetical protein
MRTTALLLAALLAAPAALAPALRQPAAAGPTTRPEGASLARVLRQQRLTQVRFEDTTLDGMVRWLRIATGHNYVVKTHVLIKAEVDVEALRFNVVLDDIAVADFLKLVLEPHGLTAVVQGNIVFITTIKDSYGRPLTRMYGIAHITWQKTDFPAPTIDLRPSGFVDTEEYQPEVPVEDDPLTDGEAVIELIKQMVEPRGWENNDDWTMAATRRYIIVRAPASVHRQIPRALAHIAAMK